MPSVPDLRALGVDGLTELLRMRPEVTEAPAPRSLVELAARLDHPSMLSASLMRLDLPTLQVAEALAALGPAADKPALSRLLGTDSTEGAAGWDAALATLSARALLVPGECRLIQPLEAGWPRPLGLDVRVPDVIATMTVAQLTGVLRAWKVPLPEPVRKASAQDAVHAVLTDADRVRAAVATAPSPVGDQLVDAATTGRRLPPSWSWSPSGYGRPTTDPLRWAGERLLVVSLSSGVRALVAEVSLALRGPDWHAPFDPEPPEVTWRPVPDETIRRVAGAAGSGAVRTVGDVIRSVTDTPLVLLKNGSVGAREIRRLAKAVGAPPERIRLVLALAHHIGLLGRRPDAVVSTASGSDWLDLSPGRALAVLVDGWASLPDIPSDGTELPWTPFVASSAVDVRRLALGLLAERPGAAPREPASLARAVYWRAPAMLGYSISTSPADDEPWDDEDEETDRVGPAPDADAHRAEATVLAVLGEAEWLGAVADGALSPAGAAALAGTGVDGVEAGIGSSVGSSEDSVVLQADLTATVLGHPSGRLVTLLDRVADREARSAATTWRFGADSVRRALDTGLTADDLLEALREVSRGEVPQALGYLITDTARRHGRLRAGSVLSYLRSDDVALLAEVTADRRLRRHGLRLVAPTVAVSSAAASDLVTALRAAGHGPVKEGADGMAILPERRVAQPAPEPSRRPPAATTARPIGPAALAADLLKAPDRSRHLLDVGQTVIDVESLREYSHRGPGT